MGDDEYNIWCDISRIRDWIISKNGDSKHQVAMRLIKLVEETGEAFQAYIGMEGQNPRKCVTHAEEDVAKELCDVIITASVALLDFSEYPGEMLQDRLAHVMRRIPAQEA